jgi:hypothetical protein
MKKIILLLTLLSCHQSFAQNWEEWTSQKKTQIKYLLQQIGANKIYIKYLQKGYSIANKGLTTIRTIKKGDFNLHHHFFESLNTINTKIKNSSKVTAIVAFQIRILNESKQSLQRVKEMDQFTHEEMNYCSTVFENLLEDCQENIDELFLVISSGLIMTDDERMKRIDKLYDDLQSKYGFCASFSNEMGVLAVQRLGEGKTLRLWEN